MSVAGSIGMNRTFILTGGNLGDRLVNLRTACVHISGMCGRLLRCSSIYETAAWGMENQPGFYNQVLELHTDLAASALLSLLLDIEQQMGRIREGKNGPRNIDIDILLYGNEIINSPGLEIPHPRMAVRRFVLTPLEELIPDYVHPVYKKTIAHLLLDCTDQLAVYKLANQPPWAAGSFAAPL